jgi:hypothetical protein
LILERRREARLREPVGEVEEDGAGFGHHDLAVLEGRHLQHRVDRAVLGRLLPAPADIDPDELVGRLDLLEHPERAEGTRARRMVELQHLAPFLPAIMQPASGPAA